MKIVITINLERTDRRTVDSAKADTDRIAKMFLMNATPARYIKGTEDDEHPGRILASGQETSHASELIAANLANTPWKGNVSISF